MIPLAVIQSFCKVATEEGSARVVEIPHSHHPVKVEPPKKKRKKYPFQGFVDFQGLKIDIENRAGTYRRGKAKDGTEWATYMHYPYGEIRETEGADGDKLDVYVGPNHDSSLVVVIHQCRPDTGAYDEDKVMLGFNSEEEAIGAYKNQYDKPGFYQEGKHTTMPIGQFWRWVHDKRKHGKKIASVGHILKQGDARTDAILKHLQRNAATYGMGAAGAGLGAYSGHQASRGKDSGQRAKTILLRAGLGGITGAGLGAAVDEERGFRAAQDAYDKAWDAKREEWARGKWKEWESRYNRGYGGGYNRSYGGGGGGGAYSGYARHGMGVDKAKAAAGFGVDPSVLRTQKDVKQAFRKASLKAHPDRGGSNEAQAELNNLWEQIQAAGWFQSMEKGASGLFDLYLDKVASIHGTDAMVEELLRMEKEARFGTYAKDFLGGVDPFGTVTSGYAQQAERQGTSAAEHRKRHTITTAGGLIGGATVVPSTIFGLVEGTKGFAKGKGLGGRLAAAGTGFARGFKQPLSELHQGVKASRVLKDVSNAGGRQLSKAERATVGGVLKKAPVGDLATTGVGSASHRLAGEAATAARTGFVSKGLADTARKPVSEAVGTGAAQLGLGGVIGGYGANVQYSKGRKAEQESQLRINSARQQGLQQGLLQAKQPGLRPKLGGMPFLKQDRPDKVKEIYAALKRDHPNMPAEMKARIAARKGKASPESRKPPETGGPAYKAPVHYEKEGRQYKPTRLSREEGL